MKQRGRLRRWLLAIAIAGFAMIGLLAGTLGLVLYTDWGTRFVLERFSDWYDGKVSGSIAIGEIEGNIAGRVVLHDLRLGDSRQRPLLEVTELSLGLAVSELWRARVVVEQLQARGLVVHLWPAPGGWEDLAPADRPSRPEGEPPGPDLPFAVGADLDLHEVSLFRHGGDDVMALLHRGRVRASLQASGREASLEVDELSGVGPAEHVVAAATAVVKWSSPRLHVQRLALVSDVALVERMEGWLDTTTPAWEASLDAVLLPGAFGAPEVPPPQVRLEGEGSFTVVRADVRATSPGLAASSMHAGVSVAGPVTTSAFHGEGWIRPEVLVSDLAGVHPVAFVGGMRLEGDEPWAIVAIASEGVLATATTDGERIDAELFAPGVRSEGHVRIDADGLAGARAQATVDSLDRLSTALGRFWAGDVPAASGAASIDARCDRGTAGLDCRAEVRGRDLALPQGEIERLDASGRVQTGFEPPRLQARVRAQGVTAGGATLSELEVEAEGTKKKLDVVVEAQRDGDRLRGTATIEPGEDERPLVVALDELEGRVRGRRLNIGEPSRIAVSDEGVEVDRLRVESGGGQLDVRGRLAWRGPSDLDVDARNLDLSVVEEFLPDLPIGGRIEARVKVRGEAISPDLALNVKARRLSWQGRALGRLALDARYADGRARIDARWRHRRAEARLRASLPMQLRLQEDALALVPDRPATASLELDRLALSTLEPWVPLRLRGSAFASLRTHGTLEAPLAVVSLTVGHLHVADHEVGNVALHATWDGERVAAFAHAAGGDFELAEASASVPLELHVPAGELAIPDQAPARFAALLRGVDLSVLEPTLGFGLQGRASAELALSSENGEVQGTLLARGRRISVDDVAIGAAELTAELDPGRLEGRFVVSGPRAHLIEGQASVPVAVRGPEGLFALQPRADLDGWIEMQSVDLAIVRGLFGEPSFAGEADAMLTVSGSLRAPRAGLVARARRLRFHGADFGTATVEGLYADKELELQLRQRKGWQSTELCARAPISIDLAAGDVEWDRHREHDVRLTLASGDRALLEPFMELPPGWGIDLSAHVRARGTIDEPNASLRARGAMSLEGERPTPFSLRARVRPGGQLARLLVGGARGRVLEVEAQTDANLAALVEGTESLGDVMLDATADTRGFDLRELGPILPTQVSNPAGRLVLHARARGPLRRPRLEGSVAIDRGAATIAAIDQRFHDILLRAKLQGSDLRLDTLRARSGSGWVSGEARLHIGRGETRGGASLVASKLPVLRPGLPLMRVDGRVVTAIDATGEVLHVDVMLDDGFVDVVGPKLIDRPARIPPMEGVVFVDEQGEERDDGEAPRPATPWVPRETVLTLEIADPVRIRGPQVDMDWDGEISLRRAPGQPVQASGAFVNEGGRVALFGNDFRIEHGEIRLPGGGEIDPYVDITATTQTSEAEVTMTVAGRVSRPTLELSSSPALPDDQIFALLVTGETESVGAGGDTAFAAKAASVLAAFENPALQQTLRDRVGIDRVGIGFADAVDQPVLTVGKRFSSKIYAETTYHHNAPDDENIAEVRLEYEITPAWSVETFFGDAAKGGVAFWWSRRFGNPRVRTRDDTAGRNDTAGRGITPKRQAGRERPR